LGYDCQQASAPFLGYSNINLAYLYSEQPMVYETQPSAAPRGLAAVSLLRPAPFDPAHEFEGIAVTIEKALRSAAFRMVRRPVGLGNEPPHIEYHLNQ
jgi:hypothetical protein